MCREHVADKACSCWLAYLILICVCDRVCVFVCEGVLSIIVGIGNDLTRPKEEWESASCFGLSEEMSYMRVCVWLGLAKFFVGLDNTIRGEVVFGLAEQVNERCAFLVYNTLLLLTRSWSWSQGSEWAGEGCFYVNVMCVRLVEHMELEFNCVTLPHIGSHQSLPERHVIDICMAWRWLYGTYDQASAWIAHMQYSTRGMFDNTTYTQITGRCTCVVLCVSCSAHMFCWAKNVTSAQSSRPVGSRNIQLVCHAAGHFIFFSRQKCKQQHSLLN